MKKTTIIQLLTIFFAFFLIVLYEIYSEVESHQREINMIDTKTGIRMSEWNVQEFKDGYVVKAESFDDSQMSGMKIGKPIWYIEGDTVYWVNGKAKSISYAWKEAPEDIQDAILNPELVAQRKELLNEFDIFNLNEDLLYDYDENWDKYARAICDFGGYSLMKAPKGGFGTNYKFQICDTRVNIKLLKEATHKEWKYRWYFVEVDSHQGWLYSENIEKHNTLKPYAKELRKNPELKAKIEAEELASKNSPYLETENPNWNIVDKNGEVYTMVWTDKCYGNDFGLYEKLSDNWYGDNGKEFATINPCNKILTLEVLKEATYKEDGSSHSKYWLVNHEGSIGWINEGWLAERGSLTKS